jgi:hypothetical protein
MKELNAMIGLEQVAFRVHQFALAFIPMKTVSILMSGEAIVVQPHAAAASELRCRDARRGSEAYLIAQNILWKPW